jgi:2-polyprenyl-3-methyl-5-hydroxy-6-metoxy-1,4-benzoquinol methylase
MILPQKKENWPQLWKECYLYDTLEFFGSRENLGYTYAYRNRHNAICDSIKKYLPQGSTLIDVAASQGNFTLRMAEAGYNMIWNDLRVDLVDYVKLKYETGQVTFIPGNVFEVDLPQKVDGVIITEIIEHVAHPDEFLRKIASLVRKGGYIFMSTPLGNYFLNRLPRFSDCPDPSQFEAVQFKPNSDGHIFLLHLDEVQPLGLDAGLVIEELSIHNNFLTAGHMKMQMALKVMPEKLVRLIEKGARKLPSFVRNRIHTGMAVTLRKP